MHNIQTQHEKHETALSLCIKPGAAEQKHIFTFAKCHKSAIFQSRIGNYDLWNLEIKVAIKGSAIQTLWYVAPYIHVSVPGSAQHKHMSSGAGREGEWEQGWPVAPTEVRLYVRKQIYGCTTWQGSAGEV